MSRTRCKKLAAAEFGKGTTLQQWWLKQRTICCYGWSCKNVFTALKGWRWRQSPERDQKCHAEKVRWGERQKRLKMWECFTWHHLRHHYEEPNTESDACNPRKERKISSFSAWSNMWAPHQLSQQEPIQRQTLFRWWLLFHGTQLRPTASHWAEGAKMKLQLVIEIERLKTFLTAACLWALEQPVRFQQAQAKAKSSSRKKVKTATTKEMSGSASP